MDVVKINYTTDSKEDCVKKGILSFLPLCLMAALLNYGCAQQSSDSGTATSVHGQQQAALVYKGKIVGKSKKAQTISIKVGKGDKSRTVMVKFDRRTKGIEHASKGHAAIVTYRMRNGEPWATSIKPKLAKLPKGVTELKTAELKTLMENTTDFTLIDARPAFRYAASHIAGALNLPVPDYPEKSATVLPKDKDQLLVLYCGGPT